MSLQGTTLLLARVLAKTAPGGKGKVTYVSHVKEDEQLPSGIDTLWTMVGTAHAADEACTSLVIVSDLK